MESATVVLDSNGNAKGSAKAAAVMQEGQSAREIARVKAGHLQSLARLVLFTPELPEGETNHFSVVAVNDIKWVPPGISTKVKLSDLDRCQLRTFQYTDGVTPDCKSCVFARVEGGSCFTLVLH